jgi:hypothetical protein
MVPDAAAKTAKVGVALLLTVWVALAVCPAGPPMHTPVAELVWQMVSARGRAGGIATGVAVIVSPLPRLNVATAKAFSPQPAHP